jgi:hypothetical protein
MRYAFILISPFLLITAGLFVAQHYGAFEFSFLWDLLADASVRNLMLNQAEQQPLMLLGYNVMLMAYAVLLWIVIRKWQRKLPRGFNVE